MEWRGNTVLPISPPAGSLLCPRSVVTNVFCHLTFAEQRETAGAWLARLCDPAPGQATVGSCPRSHAPRAALMGPHSNQGHLKQDTSPRPATRQQCSSTATVVFKSAPCTLMISSLVERSPGWQQEVTSVQCPHHAGSAECQDRTGGCGGAPGCIQQLSCSVDCKHQIAEKLFSRNVRP